MIKVVCCSRKRADVIDPECRELAPEMAEELAIGTTYVVYGQCLAKGCLLYLLDPPTRDGSVRPFWYPASLFSVVDSTLPSSWRFRLYPQLGFSGFVTAIWGYEALTTSPEHFSGLIEREAQAVEQFRQLRAQIQKEAESLKIDM